MSPRPLCLITGANAGIGRATAAALAPTHDLALVCRNPQRGAEAARELGELAGPQGRVELLLADLSDQSQIRAMAQEFEQVWGQRGLDVLVNNAGAIFGQHQLSTDGYEMTWALNHLGYFLTTHCLAGALERADHARVINVSSSAHKRGIIRFDDIRYKRAFNGFQAYCDSKLANVLFTRELARRWSHLGITVNALHPGFVGSNFGSGEGASKLMRGVMKVAKPFNRSTDKGAETVIFLATDPSLEQTTGRYFADKKARKPSKLALDDEVAKRLWYISEEMTDTI